VVPVEVAAGCGGCTGGEMHVHCDTRWQTEHRRESIRAACAGKPVRGANDGGAAV
jgi:hypothetical protein